MEKNRREMAEDAASSKNIGWKIPRSKNTLQGSSATSMSLAINKIETFGRNSEQKSSVRQTCKNLACKNMR